MPGVQPMTIDLNAHAVVLTVLLDGRWDLKRNIGDTEIAAVLRGIADRLAPA